jgi:hypothetical protein
VSFGPNPAPPNGESSGTELLDGPAADQQITESVIVQLADGSPSGLSATITVPACEGPSVPPDVTFTFAKTTSTQTAAIGDVVSYTYCGRNTSDIPLEVVRLVDDRLGVVIALPNVDTVVPPAKRCATPISVCRSITRWRHPTWGPPSSTTPS